MTLRAGSLEKLRQGPFQWHRQQMVKADFGQAAPPNDDPNDNFRRCCSFS
jgi:hypothetical protein